MITTFLGLSIRIWGFAGNPDNNVRTAGGSFADIGEWFMNTSIGSLFVCTGNVSGAQTWQTTTNSAIVQAIIANTVLQSDWNQATSTVQDYIKNKPTIPAAQIQSDWSQANSASLDFIKNKPSARSQSSATRALNTVFQVSATRWSVVRYSVDISTTVSLTGGAVGNVILETAINAAFTTGVQTLQQFGNGNTGTLVIGLVLTQLTTACLSGEIPPGNYVRLRTVNTTGTPVFTYQVGQEVLN